MLFFSKNKYKTIKIIEQFFFIILFLFCKAKTNGLSCLVVYICKSMIGNAVIYKCDISVSPINKISVCDTNK